MDLLATAGEAEQRREEATDASGDGTQDTDAVQSRVDKQGVILEILLSAFGDMSEVVEDAEATVKPLLPYFLSPLMGEGNADRRLAAMRLMRLTNAMPDKGLAGLSISIAGPLIRAYMGVGTSSERCAILRALDCLVVRAPTQMKVFVPQLQSTYFRGLADEDDLVSGQAAEAIHQLLPLVPRADGLLSSFAALLRSESAQRVRVLVACVKTMEYLHRNAALDWSKSAALQARGREIRDVLFGLSHVQDDEARESGEAVRACLALLDFK